jgi:phenylalanyl-tRNA synthetase alpha chain
MLVSGEWKDVTFKKYDVKLESAHVQPGKTHPLRKIIDEVRQVFLEMGFTEIESPVVDTSFWVFDALFQPQDHPAREMQDTFFTNPPEFGALPAEELVRRVKEVHETGGDTGSLGWRYDWSEEKARRVVLRTHTTATTIRYLAEHPDPPSKVFSVDRVFRREKVTFKHLPEFIQVDGIIVDEGASLSTLLGTLSEFYRKMGVTELKFRPSFFPYTEPSAEPYAFFRGEWMELGGSGVFRPEVTRPLGCKVPVLAWGLGLERLAMVRFGVEDIRELYFTDLDWVRGIPLCR